MPFRAECLQRHSPSMHDPCTQTLERKLVPASKCTARERLLLAVGQLLPAAGQLFAAAVQLLLTVVQRSVQPRKCKRNSSSLGVRP